MNFILEDGTVIVVDIFTDFEEYLNNYFEENTKVIMKSVKGDSNLIKDICTYGYSMEEFEYAGKKFYLIYDGYFTFGDLYKFVSSLQSTLSII